MHLLLRIPGAAASPKLTGAGQISRAPAHHSSTSGSRHMLAWAWPFSKRGEASAADQNQTQLQNLLNVAYAAARSGDFSSESTGRVAAALAHVPIQELGLEQPVGRSTAASSVSASSPPIEYVHIFDDGLLSMGVFKLPVGSIIPLHNHRGMHVFSRVLYGRINLRALDWCSGPPPCSRDRASNAAAPAVLKMDEAIDSEHAPAVLTPSDCNMHCFTAMADTAILDVLMPPYNSRGGRGCTYYEEITPAAGAIVGTECSLREIPEPADFCVVGRAYKGLKVHPNMDI